MGAMVRSIGVLQGGVADAQVEAQIAHQSQVKWSGDSGKQLPLPGWACGHAGRSSDTSDGREASELASTRN